MNGYARSYPFIRFSHPLAVSPSPTHPTLLLPQILFQLVLVQRIRLEQIHASQPLEFLKRMGRIRCAIRVQKIQIEQIRASVTVADGEMLRGGVKKGLGDAQPQHRHHRAVTRAVQTCNVFFASAHLALWNLLRRCRSSRYATARW